LKLYVSFAKETYERDDILQSYLKTYSKMFSRIVSNDSSRVMVRGCYD